MKLNITKIFLTAFLFAAFGFAWGCSSPQPELTKSAPHVDIAMQFEGCVDCDQLFLESVGLSGKHNYCAAFLSYTLEKSEAVSPAVRSARVRDFVISESIDYRHIVRGTRQVQKGDIIIWTQEYSHIGFAAENWEGISGKTIEGNTSAPGKPNVRGVFVKERSFSAGSYFRPRYLTKVLYHEYSKQ